MSSSVTSVNSVYYYSREKQKTVNQIKILLEMKLEKNRCFFLSPYKCDEPINGVTAFFFLRSIVNNCRIRVVDNVWYRKAKTLAFVGKNVCVRCRCQVRSYRPNGSPHCGGNRSRNDFSFGWFCVVEPSLYFVLATISLDDHNSAMCIFQLNWMPAAAAAADVDGAAQITKKAQRNGRKSVVCSCCTCRSAFVVAHTLLATNNESHLRFLFVRWEPERVLPERYRVCTV